MSNDAFEPVFVFFAFKKIFEEIFLRKTVVYAVTIRLLRQFKEFQRNRTSIFLSCPPFRK